MEEIFRDDQGIIMREYKNNGEFDGEHREKSREFEIVRYFINGRQEGVRKRLLDGNTLSTFYKNNKEIGYYIDTKEDGRKQYSEYEINGKKEGTDISYRTNGLRERVIKFINGCDEEEMILMNGDGSTESYIYHRNNKVDGEYYGSTIKGYGINGKTEGFRKELVDMYYTNKVSIYYINGKKNGVGKKIYWGTKIPIYHFINDMLEGKITDYYETCKKMKRCYYIYGRIEGIYTQWNKNGTIDKIIDHLNGYGCKFVFVDKEDTKNIEIKLYDNGKYKIITENICHNDGNECSICRLEHMDNMIMLPCHHSFHVECLFKWFDQIKQTNDFECPYCKTEIDWKNVKKIEK